MPLELGPREPEPRPRIPDLEAGQAAVAEAEPSPAVSLPGQFPDEEPSSPSGGPRPPAHPPQSGKQQRLERPQRDEPAVSSSGPRPPRHPPSRPQRAAEPSLPDSPHGALRKALQAPAAAGQPDTPLGALRMGAAMPDTPLAAFQLTANSETPSSLPMQTTAGSEEWSLSGSPARGGMLLVPRGDQESPMLIEADVTQPWHADDLAQVIGNPSLTQGSGGAFASAQPPGASASGTQGTTLDLPSAAQLEADTVFRIIDPLGVGSVSQLEFIGAVASDPRVAAFVFPGSSPSLTEEDETRLEKARQAVQAISRGQPLVGYIDIAKHLSSDDELRRLFAHFDPEGTGAVLQADLLKAACSDASLADFWLPSRSGVKTTEEDRRAALEALFSALGDETGMVTFAKFSSHIRTGTALRTIFSNRIDVDACNTVTKFEILGAMAQSATVVMYLLADFSGRLTSIDEQRLQQTEAIFKVLADGKRRFTQEDFVEHFGRPAQAASTEIVPGAVAEACAEVAPAVQAVVVHDGEEADQLLAIDGPLAKKERDWDDPWNWDELAFLRKLLKKADHPLDALPVKIADSEVKVAVNGPDIYPKVMNYEDHYEHFPVFCLTISFLQLMAYLISAGDEITFTGPVGQPSSMWMMVYDNNCHGVKEQVWRLWTYQWIHGSIMHVSGNIFGNIVIGGLLEAVHSTKRIAFLYTLGVITGGLACGTFQPHIAVVGSSGGVYTMVGARIANIIINMDSMRKTWKIRAAAVAAFVIYDVYMFATSYSESTSYSAHFGGLVCGALCGSAILENLEERPWEEVAINWMKRVYLLGLVFMMAWYVMQEAERPQGVFDSAGYCRFSEA